MSNSVERTNNDLSKEVETKLSLTLYDHVQTTISGYLCHSLASLTAYFSTYDIVYIYAVLAITLIFAVRVYDTASFHRAARIQKDLDSAFAKRWETRYLLGGMLIATWLGGIAFYSMVSHTYTIISFITIGLCFGTQASVVSRNFASKKLVDIMMAVGCLPMAAALVYIGWRDSSYPAYITSVVLGIFLFMSRYMANYVRNFATDSLMNSRKYEMIASKFNAAINNQPNGMIMFDKNLRISVINPKACELLGGGRYSEFKGMSVRDLLDHVKDIRGYTEVEFSHIRQGVTSLIEGKTDKIQIKTKNDRYIEFETTRDHPTALRNRITPFSGSVVVFEDVTDRVLTEEKITKLAHYDSLSKLSTRGYWNDQVLAAIKNMAPDETIAVCLLDIDRFKLINDTMGHNAGDNAIKLVAKRLQEISDKRAILGRYGGDEFVVAFPGIRPDDSVSDLVDSIFNRVNSNYVIQGNSVEITVAGGVYQHKHGPFHLEEAVSKADTALRKVKQSPHVWFFFTNEMEIEHTRDLAMKAAIKDAITNNSFNVVYQPMFNADGSEFDCCEALARWHHPTLGQVRPDDFIRIAEELGTIQSLTRQILQRACADCVTWPGNISVSVNLSTLDLSHPDVVSMVHSCLESSGLDPKRLQIEVTETVFVNDFEKTARTLNALSALGIKIALDDFGTGYSSLSYLNKLPLDKVKIDRAFTLNLAKDERARLLFNGIVRLSKELKFEIVVEGVENVEQLDLVTANDGVDRIQGFVFSRPETSDEIIRMLDHTEPPTPGPTRRLVHMSEYQRKKKV